MTISIIKVSCKEHSVQKVYIVVISCYDLVIEITMLTNIFMDIR